MNRIDSCLPRNSRFNGIMRAIAREYAELEDLSSQRQILRGEGLLCICRPLTNAPPLFLKLGEKGPQTRKKGVLSQFEGGGGSKYSLPTRMVVPLFTRKAQISPLPIMIFEYALDS